MDNREPRKDTNARRKANTRATIANHAPSNLRFGTLTRQPYPESLAAEAPAATGFPPVFLPASAPPDAPPIPDDPDVPPVADAPPLLPGPSEAASASTAQRLFASQA